MPGCGSEAVRAYKRPALSELHRARAAAVRKAAADAAPAAPAPTGDAREPAAAPQAAQVLRLARLCVEAWGAWRVMGRRAVPQPALPVKGMAPPASVSKPSGPLCTGVTALMHGLRCSPRQADAAAAAGGKQGGAKPAAAAPKAAPPPGAELGQAGAGAANGSL